MIVDQTITAREPKPGREGAQDKVGRGLPRKAEGRWPWLLWSGVTTRVENKSPEASGRQGRERSSGWELEMEKSSVGAVSLEEWGWKTCDTDCMVRRACGPCPNCSLGSLQRGVGAGLQLGVAWP